MTEILAIPPATTFDRDQLVNPPSGATIFNTDVAQVQVTPNGGLNWVSSPTTNGAGATGTWGINITGNAASVTTNANLSGVVTSIGNTTSIPNGNITDAMMQNQKLSLSGGTMTGTITTTSLSDALYSAGLINIKSDGGDINFLLFNGVGYQEIQFNGTGINMFSGFINNLHDPVSAQDAATKNYVDMTSAPSVSVTNVTTASQFMSDTTIINRYVINSLSTCTITLPVTAVVGHSFEIIGGRVSQWILAQNSGQNIQFGNDYTTVGTGGSLNSTLTGDSIIIVCTAASTDFTAFAPQGNIFVT